MDSNRSPLKRTLLTLVPVIFVGYFFVYPLARLGFKASISPATLGEALSDPRVQDSLRFTFAQAALSTVLTVVFALPLTAVLSRFRFPGRDLVRAWVTVPFVLPSVVVGSAFLALGLDGSWWAVIAAHVFYNLAVVVRTVGTVWSRMDPTLVSAARTLGASRWESFQKITLPLLAPSIAAAASVVFLFCFTSFGVVLILGGMKYRTLEVEIYQRTVTFLDLPAAVSLALIQLIGISLVMLIYNRFQESRSVRFRLVSESECLQPTDTLRRRLTVATVVFLTLGLQSVPLIAMAVRSITGGGWRRLTTGQTGSTLPLEAIGNSSVFALTAALIAVTIGGIAAWIIAGGTRTGRWIDLSLMLPLGTSSVTIGLAFLIALDSPIDLRTRWIIVPLAHALVAIPFVVRATVPALRAIRQDLRETAAILGASPKRVWREVDLPIAARALGVGAGFAAAISLGEFGATAFIARPATTTIPTLIFKYLSQPGSSSLPAALAMALILMAVTAAVMLGSDRIRLRGEGGF